MLAAATKSFSDQMDPCVGGEQMMKAENNSYGVANGNTLSELNGMNIPTTNQSSGSLDATASSDVDWLALNWREDLDQSVLNNGLAWGSPTAMTGLEQLQTNFDASGALTNQNNQYQHSAFASLPTQYTNDYLNTSPVNISNHTSRPHKQQRTSQLRNEYNPEAESSEYSGVMTGPSHGFHITTSPANYVTRPASTQAAQRSRSFQESNVRSSAHRAYDNMAIHQFGYRPNYQSSQPQLRSSYHESQQLHPSGQLSYGLNDQQLPSQIQQYESATTQPSTPPTLHPSCIRNDFSSSPMIRDSSNSSVGIKHEPSTSGSPLKDKETRKESRKRPRRKTIALTDTFDEADVSTSTLDSHYVQNLMDAMVDEEEAEDNPGMQSTWNKIKENKQHKLRETCVGLLGLLKRAQREQLGEKKAVNPYPDFDHRFEEMCAALRTQKTICKHLMEPPYAHTVTNDPTYAAQAS